MHRDMPAGHRPQHAPLLSYPLMHFWEEKRSARRAGRITVVSSCTRTPPATASPLYSPSTTVGVGRVHGLYRPVLVKSCRGIRPYWARASLPPRGSHATRWSCMRTPRSHAGLKGIFTQGSRLSVADQDVLSIGDSMLREEHRCKPECGLVKGHSRPPACPWRRLRAVEPSTPRCVHGQVLACWRAAGRWPRLGLRALL